MDAETEPAVAARRSWRLFMSARTVVFANALFGVLVGASLSLIAWLELLDILNEARCSSKTTTVLCATHTVRVALWGTAASVFTAIYLTSAVGFIAVLRRQRQLALIYAVLLAFSLLATLGIGITTIVLHVVRHLDVGVSLIPMVVVYALLWLCQTGAFIAAYRLIRARPEPLTAPDPFILSFSLSSTESASVYSPSLKSPAPTLLAHSSFLARIESALAFDVQRIDRVLAFSADAEGAALRLPEVPRVDFAASLAPVMRVELPGLLQEAAPARATSMVQLSSIAPLSTTTARRSSSTAPRSPSTPALFKSTTPRSIPTAPLSTSTTANSTSPRSFPPAASRTFVPTHKRTRTRDSLDVLRTAQMQMRRKGEVNEVVIGMDVLMEDVEGEHEDEKEQEKEKEKRERRTSAVSVSTISGKLMRAVLAVRESTLQMEGERAYAELGEKLGRMREVKNETNAAEEVKEEAEEGSLRVPLEDGGVGRPRKLSGTKRYALARLKWPVQSQHGRRGTV